MDAEERQELVAQGKEMKDRLALLDSELDTLESHLQMEGQKLPNLTHPEVSCPCDLLDFNLGPESQLCDR